MRKKGVLFTIIVAALILAILVGIFFLLFNVKSVNVYGNSEFKMLDKADLQSFADGYAKGIVFLFDKEGFVGELEDAYPYARVENVEIIFPNVVEVSATERTALFAIEHGGSYYLFDRDGALLEKVNSNVGKDGSYACILVDEPIDFVVSIPEQSIPEDYMRTDGLIFPEKEEMDMVLKFFELMMLLEYDYTEAELKGMLYSVTVENGNTLRAKTRFGTEFCIYDFDNAPENKVAYIMGAFTSGAVTDPSSVLFVGDDLKVIAGKR